MMPAILMSQNQIKPELKGPKVQRVFLETLGCQMNVLDSELVHGQLTGLGYQFVDDWKSADVVLYNTCSVRARAEHKVNSRVGEVGKFKQNERPDLVLGVIGCMAERQGEAMVTQYPQIDLMCGPGELDKLPMLIDNVVKTSLSLRGGKKAVQAALQGNTHRRSSTLSAAEDQLELLDLARSFSPDEHHGSAYVRITRGCNKFCSFCVVPFTRGAEIHRPPHHIIDECKRLADAGVVEVTLIGQTVNHYHFDNSAAITVDGVVQPQIGAAVSGPTHSSPASVATGKITSFADLLYQIHEQVPGLARIRFVTSYPRDFGDDILQVMKDCPRICRYLHLPVQSGSNRILKLMNRGYTVEDYRDLLQRVGEFLPDAMVASDIICGFPTETDEDHQRTIQLLTESQFKNCFIFKYSTRPGTTAHDRLPDDVPENIKKKRNNELLAVQSGNSAKIHDRYVGKTVRMFVESISQRASKQIKQSEDRGGPDHAQALGGKVILGWETNSDQPALNELPLNQSAPTLQLSGRTGGDLIVMCDGDRSLIGSIVDVKIDRAAPLTLFGSLVDQPVQV
jgi:tRNA-2-methylthio-N6-dimethylallyladenosine synthase